MVEKLDDEVEDWHGTYAGYTRHGCREACCQAAAAVVKRRSRASADGWEAEDLEFAATFQATALMGVPQPGPWSKWGACRNAPPSMFFPVRGESPAPAVEICGKCGVQPQCRQYALDAGPQLAGVWGGLTDFDRRRMRKAAAEEAFAELPEEEQVEQRRYEHGPGELYAHLEELTEHPGQWAEVATWRNVGSAQSTASLLRHGRRKCPPGRFVFEGRRNPDGSSTLYAMYEGPE